VFSFRGIMPKRRFQTGGDCRRYLASVINRIEAGELDPAKGGRLAYIVQILVRILETTDIEDRLAAIEKNLGGKT
jgi:hypothetical protein